MKKETKTNAMRILDNSNISYNIHTYEVDEDHISGLDVAKQLHEDPNRLFKTIVCVGKSKNFFVFCIPVNQELDLKKCAKAVNEKNIELLPLKELTKTTGYIRGGCSPLGMKKLFKTTIDETAILFDTIIFSGGKRGVQIECNPNDLANVVKADFYDICK